MNTALVSLALIATSAPAPDVSEPVRTGLDWLAKQQQPAGNWTITNNNAPTRITVVAGLALLMEGSTLDSGTYAPNLRKAVAWLEAKTAETKILGLDRGAGDTVSRDHAHAILFLASVHDTDEDPERAARIAKLIKQAIADLVKFQTARGGWGVYLGANLTDDTSEWTADVLHSLFVARRVGFDVPHKVTNAGLNYLTRATNRVGGVVQSANIRTPVQSGETHLMSTFSAAAVALTADRVKPDALPKWLNATFPSSLKQMQEIRTGGSHVMLHQFHAAHASFALGDRGHRDLDAVAPDAELVKWSAYHAQLFKALKDARDKNGVWTDAGHGQTYPTALALIILQFDNGYIPAFSR